MTEHLRADQPRRRLLPHLLNVPMIQGIKRSGYYSWRDRPQSQMAIRREELAMMIKDIFEHS